jgi:hypothetical protein
MRQVCLYLDMNKAIEPDLRSAAYLNCDKSESWSRPVHARLTLPSLPCEARAAYVFVFALACDRSPWKTYLVQFTAPKLGHWWLFMDLHQVVFNRAVTSVCKRLRRRNGAPEWSLPPDDKIRQNC